MAPFRSGQPITAVGVHDDTGGIVIEACAVSSLELGGIVWRINCRPGLAAALQNLDFGFLFRSYKLDRV
jgi:hypothetical protein